MSASKVIETALARKVTIATAESCTGGMIGASLTAIAGSSAAYEGGVVSYSNTLKMKLLNVSKETLTQFGAVSRETASEMAQGALALGVDYAVAVTGIAGPGGGSREKRVGLVYIAVASHKNTVVIEKNYGDLGRETVRTNTRDDALDLLYTSMLEI